MSCLTKFMDLQIFLLTHEVIKVGKTNLLPPNILSLF